jgi:hypothetical protein
LIILKKYFKKLHGFWIFLYPFFNKKVNMALSNILLMKK